MPPALAQGAPELSQSPKQGTREWAGPAVSSFGISRVDPQPGGILAWAVSNPASSSLTLLLAFFPLEIALSVGQRQQLPLVGFVRLFVLESSQNFLTKWVFYYYVSPSRNPEYSSVP